jgi:hypothetical protein
MVANIMKEKTPFAPLGLYRKGPLDIPQVIPILKKLIFASAKIFSPFCSASLR